MNNTVSFPKCLTSFHLKVIAIVSMLIDHFAYIFFASVLSASYMVQNGTVVYADFRQAFLLWVAENHTILWNINDIMHWIGSFHQRTDTVYTEHLVCTTICAAGCPAGGNV